MTIYIDYDDHDENDDNCVYDDDDNVDSKDDDDDDEYSIELNYQSGKTSLHFACRHGFLDIVVILIDHGADVNLPDNVRTIVMEGV